MPAAVGAFVLPSLAGTMTASVVGGAIIGAAIGGITAAITGGDIGKGLLFGAVGGAVTGAVSYGLNSVLQNMGTGAQTAFKSTEVATGSVRGVGGLSGSTGVKVLGGGTVEKAVTQVTGATVKEAAKKGATSTFLSKLGDSLGDGFGVAAVTAGLGGIKDIYLSGKEAEAQAEQAALQRQHEAEMQRREIASAEKIAAMRSGGGGGGGGGGRPEMPWPNTEEGAKWLAEHERESALAQISEQIAGERSLAQQQIDEQAAARERMKAGALVGPSAQRRRGSRSTETLADIQDRIREGEDVEGDPNIGVDVPVDYVPPETPEPTYTP